MIGGFVTLAIVVIIIIICKKKNKRESEKFKAALSSHFAEFSNRTDYFENIFEMIMEHEGVQKASVDKILQELPTYKEQFTCACNKLIALSEHNICLFNKEKYANADFTHDSLTRDTIEVLPALGEYFKWYNTFYRDIYKEVLIKKFCFRINDMAFGIALSKESDYESKEKYENAMRAFVKTVDNFFQNEIRNTIKEFLGIEACVDIQDTKNLKIKGISPKINLLLKFAQEYSDQENLFEEFLDIWVSKMQKIGRKYAEAHLALERYFDEKEAQMKQHIEDYSIYDMFWLNCWAPRLDEKTQEECLRVLELYNSGRLSGVYHGRHSEDKA